MRGSVMNKTLIQSVGWGSVDESFEIDFPKLRSHGATKGKTETT